MPTTADVVPAATRIDDIFGRPTGDQFLLRVSVRIDELGGWHRLYFGPVTGAAAADAGRALAAAARREVVFSVEPLRAVPGQPGRCAGSSPSAVSDVGAQ